MTPSRPPDQLDVPIERLAAGRGQARRAGAVAAAIVLVVGGAFALARWTETRSSATQPSGSSGPRTVDVRRSIPAPSAARRSTPPRVEALPDVRSVALPGAPEVTFVERTGPQLQDLRILVWTPDDGRTRTIRAFNGAAADEPADESIFPVVSPDRHGLVILSGGGSSGGEARLLNDDGRRLWSGDGIAVESGALWSADSRLVVLAGRPRRWQIVRLDRPGHATAKTVTLPFEVYTPKPLPNGWLTFPTDDPRTVPIGFSADGRWIYGGVVSAQLGILVAVFRVASDGSSVEHLTDFRVGTPDGLVPRPGTIGVRIVDPGTGRVVNERANIDVTGGPRTVEVRDPDAGLAFTVDAPASYGEEWTDDGRLLVLSADSLLFPDSIELREVGPDGRNGEPLLATGPLAGGVLIGSRDGFAVVALLATRPDIKGQFVALDLHHPERRTSLALPFGDDVSLLAASLDR